MSERYVTAGELAELMGVSLRTVQRMTAAGMPAESWGMAHVRRYRPSEAIAWARRGRVTVGRLEYVRSPGGAANTGSGPIDQTKE